MHFQIPSSESLRVLAQLRDGLKDGHRWVVVHTGDPVIDGGDLLTIDTYAAAITFQQQQAARKQPYAVLPLTQLFDRVFEGTFNSGGSGKSPKNQPATITLDMAVMEYEAKRITHQTIQTEKLITEMKQLGFSAIDAGQLELHLGEGKAQTSFNIIDRKETAWLHYQLDLQKNEKDDYILKGFEASMLDLPQLRPSRIGQIEILAIDRMMSSVDWDSYGSNRKVSAFTSLTHRRYAGSEKVGNILDILDTLRHTSDEGKEVALQLELKHWHHNAATSAIVNREQGLADYSKRIYIDRLRHPWITADQSYHLLEGRSVGYKVAGSDPSMAITSWATAFERKDSKNRQMLLDLSFEALHEPVTGQLDYYPLLENYDPDKKRQLEDSLLEGGAVDALYKYEDMIIPVRVSVDGVRLVLNIDYSYHGYSIVPNSIHPAGPENQQKAQLRGDLDFEEWLRYQIDMGKKWVVLSQSGDYHQCACCFASSIAAEAYCEQNSTAENGLRYYQSEAILSAVLGRKGLDDSIDTHAVKAMKDLIEFNHPEIILPEDSSALITSLSKNLLTAVTIKRELRPNHYIEDYRIIPFYADRTRYKERIGEPLGIYTQYAAAMKAMEKWEERKSDYEKMNYPDMLLVARYENQALLLNREGRAVNNTGILLDAAWLCLDPKGQKTYAFQHFHRPEEMIKVRMNMMARFDPVSMSIKYFDDRLKPVNYLDTAASLALHYLDPAIIQIQKKTVMEEGKTKKTPEEAIKGTLLGLGFERNKAIMQKLDEHLAKKSPEFTINGVFEYAHPETGKEQKMDVALYFRWPDPNRNIFFNKWDGILKMEDQPDRKHTFYIDEGKGITAKQGFNLLNGRAVYSLFEGPNGKYNAWMVLNLDEEQKKQNGNYPDQKFNDKYGFKVERAVSALPVRYSEKYTQQNLVDAMKRGNLEKVVLEYNGETAPGFVQPYPEKRELHLSKSLSDFVAKHEIDISPSKRESKSKGTEEKEVSKKDNSDDLEDRSPKMRRKP